RSANHAAIAREESDAGEGRQRSVKVISGAHLGAGDSRGFKNGTAPDVLRDAQRRQAAAKHDRRGMREDFYRGPADGGGACVERVPEVACNLEDIEACSHPAMQLPCELGCGRGKDAYAKGLELPLDGP